MRLGAAALAVAGLAACSRDPPPAPLPARDEWRVECRPVKDDLHQACYGPGWAAQRAREAGRYHFYQVSVERKQASDAPLVLFVKRVDAAGVDARVLAEGAEVARYDAAARAVRFDIGREPVVFEMEKDK